MTETITLEIRGRPSPWANGDHESRWRQAVADQARLAIEAPFDAAVRPTRVVVEFRMIGTRRGDLDNLAKPVLDTLFRQSRRSKHPIACIFGCDDFHLDELVLRRIRVETAESEGATITIVLQ